MEKSSGLPAFIELTLKFLEVELEKRKMLLEDPVNGINGSGGGRIKRSRTAGNVSFGGSGRVGGRPLTTAEKGLDKCEHKADAFRGLLGQAELSSDEREVLTLRLEELEERCRPLDDTLCYDRIPAMFVPEEP